MNFERVTVCHLKLRKSVSAWQDSKSSQPGQTHRIRTIRGVDPRPIEQKTHRCGSLALTLTEGVHEFGEGGGALDLEEDFVIVVGDFDVKVLGFGLILWVASGTWRLITVGHRD